MTNIDRVSTDLLLYENRGFWDETFKCCRVILFYIIYSWNYVFQTINDIKILTRGWDFIDTRV